MKQTDSKLAELADTVIRRGEFYGTIEGDRSYADVTLEWSKPGLYVSVETFNQGKTYPATRFEPAETVWHPRYTGSREFASINQVAGWLWQEYGFDLRQVTKR